MTDHPPAPRRRRSAPRGSGLYFDERRGVFYWRKVHPKTGARLVKATGQRRLELAMRVAARFDDELRAELAGVRTFDEWRVELAPLVVRWVDALDGLNGPSKPVLEQKRRETLRALDVLRLSVAADLTHVGDLDDRLRALVRRGETTPTAARRQFQDPLKAFAKWLAANGRHLPSNPLLAWEPLPIPKRQQARRCVLPDEMARALLALEVLDRWNRRATSQRAFFLSLLVVGPRVTALVSRDVCDLDPSGSRIDLGEDVGDKRRGAGALDPATLADVVAALGHREEGPLYLSPDGARWTRERALDAWREAFVLGIVAELWPADVAPDQALAVLAAKALVQGRPRVSKGGRPSTDAERRAEVDRARRELEERVSALADRLRDDVEDRLDGIDLHAMRMAHQTWAVALGVPAAVVDRQLGHAGQAADRALSAVKAVLSGSRTGARHYLDLGSAMIDPQRSAAAVRARLDEAEAALRADPPAVLVNPTKIEARIHPDSHSAGAG